MSSNICSSELLTSDISRLLILASENSFENSSMFSLRGETSLEQKSEEAERKPLFSMRRYHGVIFIKSPFQAVIYLRFPLHGGHGGPSIARGVRCWSQTETNGAAWFINRKTSRRRNYCRTRTGCKMKQVVAQRLPICEPGDVVGGLKRGQRNGGRTDRT